MDNASPVVSGIVAATAGSLASSDELQSLLVALFAIAVREVVYWFKNRRKSGSDLDLTNGG